MGAAQDEDQGFEVAWVEESCGGSTIRFGPEGECCFK